jgi:aminoglycoside/choline kinase family phosphotransferase
MKQFIDTFLLNWLPSINTSDFKIEDIQNDASHREYFRVITNKNNYVVMHNPLVNSDESDGNDMFMYIAHRLYKNGFNVPEIIEENPRQGLLLLSDLGKQSYLDILNNNNVERLYGDALSSLVAIQASVSTENLPIYDENLLNMEMNLFTDWFLVKHLNIKLNDDEKIELKQCFDLLVINALEQPQVFVHRDYHSRNLLYSPKYNPAILDFQDAVLGAITYDLVSLLRDCYIVWSPKQVRDWVLGYYELLIQSGLISKEISENKFLRWFDLMGLQRHIKVTLFLSPLSFFSTFLKNSVTPFFLHFIQYLILFEPSSSFIRIPSIL